VQHLPRKFFIDRLKLNPWNDPPPKSFDNILMRWKLSRDHGGVQANALVLENSYRCLEIADMFTLREIFDLEKNVDFHEHKVDGTIVVVCTTNNFEELTVWKGDKWESMLVAIKDCIMHISVYVCICKKESFGYVMLIIHKTMIGLYITYEIGTYSAHPEELLNGNVTTLKILLLLFVYLFRT
jgi:hypothetical protein